MTQPPQPTEASDPETPSDVLARLKAGNRRFVRGAAGDHPWLEQVDQTAAGQHPFVAVLGCIDSRVPVELIFDLGIGDAFVIRVAGNVVNDDILGSLEFACAVAGARAVVVLGHTACGAVKGSIAGVELDHLTGLLAKIRPAIAAVPEGEDANAYADAVAAQNAKASVDAIRVRSPVLQRMEKDGEITIAAAMYDVGTGTVEFFE